MVTGSSKVWVGVNNSPQPIVLGESSVDHGVHVCTIERQSITLGPASHRNSYGYPDSNSVIGESVVNLFYFNNSDILKYNKLSITTTIGDVSYNTGGTFYSGTYYLNIIPILSLERDNKDKITIPLSANGNTIDSSKQYVATHTWSLYRRIDDYGNSLGSYDNSVGITADTYIVRCATNITSSATYTVTVNGLHIEVYGYI